MMELIAVALLVVVPFPLAFVLPAPQAILYALPLALQLQRLVRGRPLIQLPQKTVEILAFACLGLFLADAWFFSRRLILVALHLSLSLIVIKAFHLSGRRDRAQFVLLVFFVGIAAAASATHITMALYLLGLLLLLGSALMQEAGIPPAHARRLAVPASCAALVLAVPLFMSFPRLHNPYVPGLRGRETESAGALSLDSISLEGAHLGGNDERIALRVQLPPGGDPEALLRLRARTLTVFNGKTWANPTTRFQYHRTDPEDIFLAPGMPPRASGRIMDVYPKDLAVSYFPAPYGTGGLRTPMSYLGIGDDGTFRPYGVITTRRFHYRAQVFEEGAIPLAAPKPAETKVLELGPDFSALALKILPLDMPAAEKLKRIVRYFETDYAYGAEDYSGSAEPLHAFLFEKKRGFCEMYATAAALMLREAGIPARVAVGFMGGEKNPLQDYYVVRFKNAHAWVEAYVDGRWRVLDPTPPGFRPQVSRGALLEQLDMVWESLSFFWDRNILGFSMEEQVTVLAWLRDHAGIGGRILAVAVLGGLAAWAWKRLPRYRRAPRIVRMYRNLRRNAARIQGRAEDRITPKDLEAHFLGRHPERASELHDFIEFYLKSSFGESTQDRAAQRTLAELYNSINK